MAACKYEITAIVDYSYNRTGAVVAVVRQVKKISEPFLVLGGDFSLMISAVFFCSPASSNPNLSRSLLYMGLYASKIPSRVREV